MRREPLLLLVLLLCTLFYSFRTKPVKASGNIYIRADGSIDPPTAPISTIDNITYILTENLINQTISIERNNTIIDGNGHTLQAQGAGTGINLDNLGEYLENVTIKNFHIDNFLYGISAFPEYGAFRRNNIFNNTFTNNGYGLFLWSFHGGYIAGNTFVNNGYGIELQLSFGNEIIANNITNNTRGIEIYNCERNKVYNNLLLNNTRALRLTLAGNQTIYNNNFFNNTIPVDSYMSQGFWNSGYPIGGNYWSHLNVTDIYSGPYQNESGSDGIGDTPYVIDGSNQDNYPLMNLYWNPADINHDLNVDIFDVVLACVAYSSTPSDLNWNCHGDIAEPYGVIDIFDIVMICASYGEEYSP